MFGFGDIEKAHANIRAHKVGLDLARAQTEAAEYKAAAEAKDRDIETVLDALIVWRVYEGGRKAVSRFLLAVATQGIKVTLDPGKSHHDTITGNLALRRSFVEGAREALKEALEAEQKTPDADLRARRCAAWPKMIENKLLGHGLIAVAGGPAV